jgi:mRNA guanylyltransferase
VSQETDGEQAVIDIYMKDVFRVSDIPQIFTHILPNLAHENDGLILTMNDCPYYPGTCQEILKWKPKELNTIDFELRLIEGSNHFALLSFAGKDGAGVTQCKIFDYLFPSNAAQYAELCDLIHKSHSKMKPLVIECSFDPDHETPDQLLYNQALSETKNEVKTTTLDKDARSTDPLLSIATREQTVLLAHKKFILAKTAGLISSEEASFKGGWQFHKIRDDKTESNFIKVALNTLVSINDSVSREDLVDVCELIKQSAN